MIAAMPGGAIHNFHLPLPRPLYRRLRDAAERAKQPATVVARYAIERWLRQQRKAMLREEIAAYAAELAGTGADLDQELEATSLEQWKTVKRAGRGKR